VDRTVKMMEGPTRAKLYQRTEF